MKFLCLYRPGTASERTAPPSPQEIETMGKLLGEMAKAGVLIATEGCMPSANGVKVRIDSGKFTLTDGPFPETKELIAGLCLMQCKSKEEAVEWGKRFLSVVGIGQSEIRQVYDTPRP